MLRFKFLDLYRDFDIDSRRTFAWGVDIKQSLRQRLGIQSHAAKNQITGAHRYVCFPMIGWPRLESSNG
jgi:hypothetical protein